MFDRFEYGRQDLQDESWDYVCDWCNCEVYPQDELFLTDCFGWVCEECYDDIQRKNKRKAAFSRQG